MTVIPSVGAAPRDPVQIWSTLTSQGSMIAMAVSFPAVIAAGVSAVSGAFKYKISHPFAGGGLSIMDRQMPTFLDPQERASGFMEDCSGLAENQLAAEAESCLNCGCACMNSCSDDVIQFDEKQGVSHKCDLCYQRITSGHEPVCVDVC